MMTQLRLLCLAIFMIGLGAKAADTDAKTDGTGETTAGEAGDPTDNDVAGALKEIQAAKKAKNKAIKTVDQMLAFLPPVVAAYDNNKSISASDIREWVKPKLQIRLKAENGTLPEAEVKKEILALVNQEIDAEVLRQLAEKAGLKPDFDAARRKIVDDVEKNPVAETLFAAQGLNLTQAIKNQAMQQLKEDWRKAVIDPKTVPSDAEIKAVYDKDFAGGEKPETRDISHILVKSSPGDSPERKAAAMKKCEDILAKVKAGGNFADLAKKYSDCPSKSKGGNLGEYAADGNLVKEFITPAFKLEEGDVSGVVGTEFGYHIIKINKISAAGRPPLERAKVEIIERLSKEKSDQLAQKTLEDARQAMPVKINL